MTELELIQLKERVIMGELLSLDQRTFVVRCLNRHAAADAVEWSCGHRAGAACAECYHALAARAHELAERNLELLAERNANL